MKIYLKYLFVAISIITLVACDDDSPYMEIAGESQLNFTFDEIAGTKFATIQSNQTFTAKSDADWCETEIYLGGRNNNLRISTTQHEGATPRTATIAVLSDNMAPISITVTQKGAAPSIAIITKSVTLSNKMQEFKIEIKSNILFEYELPFWIVAVDDNVPAIGKYPYTFKAIALLENATRDANIVVKGIGENSHVRDEIIATQTNDEVPILYDDFSYLTGSQALHTTSGEKRMTVVGSCWDTQPGWSCITDGDAGLAWSREGFAKICKGKYNALLISPKLSKIIGEQNIEVSFSACAYRSQFSATAATYDYYREVHVSVIGGGTITTSSDFDLRHYQTSTSEEWWNNPAAQFSFKVSNATSQTQIRFLIGPKVGSEEPFIGAVPPIPPDAPCVYDGGKANAAHSRIGFDEFKVMLD